MERDALIGSWLGPYQVVELLGRGGMARVYKGLQPRLKRYVALKVILPEAAAHPGFRERFEREAQVIARLYHANIVTVYDFGEARNQSYLSMQYVGGGTLGSQITGGQPMPYAQAINYMVQMARALQHAHSQGIIHRDVKPANMLIDEKDANHLLLSDFGIAKLPSGAESDLSQPGIPQSLTTTGSILGTPEFMAPEQVEGGTLDARTDMYALGVVLFIRLPGNQPFRATTPLGMLLHHVHTQPPSVSQINPSVPPRLSDAVNQALAKQPRDRFQSAEAFAQALERVVLSASQRERPPALLAPGIAPLTPETPEPRASPRQHIAPGVPPVSPPSSAPGSSPVPQSGGSTTRPQAITSPSTPTQISAPQGSHTAPTPLPGQARQIAALPSARPRRPSTSWLCAGISLVLVMAVLVILRSPLSPFASTTSTSPTAQASRTSVPGPVTATFKVNTNGWPTGHINGDAGLNWTVGNGVYDLLIPVGSAYNQSYFPTPANLGQPPANFTLEITLKQVQGAPVLGYGLVFRESIVAQNQQQLVNGYAFTINSNGQYAFQVSHLSQGLAESFSTPPPAILKAGLNQVNDLKVVVMGNAFKLYANGQLLPGPNQDDSWTNTSYASGTVGLLITGDGVAPQEYQFTSFVLTPLP